MEGCVTPKPSPRDPQDHPAERARRSRRLVHGLDPFELFCAYHLGLFPDGSVRFANLHQVAQAFGVEPEDVLEALRAYHLDPDRLLHAGVDLAGAQADVQVSPPGVDLTAVALLHYEAALVAEPESRDWRAELEEDEAANRSIFGDEDDR